MVGKAQARAPPLVKKNLKAKAGAPAAANTKRTLSKIVSTINEEANHLKSELFSDDFYTRLQQKTRDIQSRARSTGAALARAKSSLKSMKQKLSTRAASSHHRLQQANSTLASMNLAAAVEEMMSQMHRAVTDGIADAQGGKAISKQKMNTSTTARNNNSTAKRTKNVTFLSH